MPAYSYTASASAAIHCGATVKFVDIQKDGDPVTHMPEIDRSIFPTIDDLKKALDGYAALDGAITIQDEPIKHDIPKDLLDHVNSHYTPWM